VERFPFTEGDEQQRKERHLFSSEKEALHAGKGRSLSSRAWTDRACPRERGGGGGVGNGRKYGSLLLRAHEELRDTGRVSGKSGKHEEKSLLEQKQRAFPFSFCGPQSLPNTTTKEKK